MKLCELASFKACRLCNRKEHLVHSYKLTTDRFQNFFVPKCKFQQTINVQDVRAIS